MRDRRLLRSADLYVQTPAIDNMPLSMLEAFASGLPVVSTCVGGVPAVVSDGAAWTARPGERRTTRSPRESSSSSNAPTYAQQLAAAAHDKSGRYDWADVRGSWLAVYRALARPDAGAITPLEVQRSA